MAQAPNPNTFHIGDRVQLTDQKGRKHTVTLNAGGTFFTSKGAIAHDDLLGRPEGIIVTSNKGAPYLAQRPLLADFVLSMPRGATPVYPKDAAVIVGLADIHPGARVVEAGVGSAALTCSLLRAVGTSGSVTSFEQRADFAEIARTNVATFFGSEPANWSLQVGDLAAVENALPDAQGSADRVVLDMVAPWECVSAAAWLLRPGGVLCAYVATTTQMSRLVEHLRVDGRWTEPESMELLLRSWHVEGLAVRPSHRMVGHTGFLVFTRRLAPGTVLPVRRTRPAKGAYGTDYQQTQQAADAAPDVSGR